MFERVIHRTAKDWNATCSQIRRHYIPGVFLNLVVYKFFKSGTAKRQRQNGNGVVETRVVCDLWWQSRLCPYIVAVSGDNYNNCIVYIVHSIVAENGDYIE